MRGDLDEARRRFAAELAERVGVRSARVRAVLAEVPRERFHRDGPWLIFDTDGYTSTPDADPRRLYADVSVALDSSRFINNSSPGLVARMLDALDPAEGATVVHVGCGSGYYTAMLARLVGRAGRVRAVELEPGLARRARRNLRRLRQVEVVHGDGLELDPGPADAMLVSAGVTHPRPRWLDALRPGGRLVVPLTAIRPPGLTARVVRDHAGLVLRVERTAEGWAARFIDRVAIPPLLGGRDPDVQRRLADVLRRDEAQRVRSLRREPHAHDATCWLTAPELCLSTREPAA